MPTQDFGVYPDSLTIGTEVSSTYEGRHVTLLASEINHGNVLAVVTKGYPVIFGTITGNAGVGIALNTEVAATDLIAIDTEGIWNVSVVATDDAGASLVTGGDPLYINTTTAVVSKIRTTATQIPFGYALGQVAAGATAVIAVKVHWDPPESAEFFGDKVFHGAVTMNSTLTVAGLTQLNGVVIIATGMLYLGAGITVTGAAVFNSGINVAGGINITGMAICNGGISVAGTTDLQIVTVHSSLAIAAGGTLTLPQVVDASQLPVGAGAVNTLWVNAGVVTRV
jgi:hypothetical protein